MNQFDSGTLEALEFPRIRQEVTKRCLTDGGIALAGQLRPLVDLLLIEPALLETFEMKEIREFEEAIPLERQDGLEKLIGKLRIEGSILDAEQLKRLSDFQKTVLALFQYRIHKVEKYPRVCKYLEQLRPLNDVILRIDKAIDVGGEIRDSASDRLRRIRAEKAGSRAQIMTRLQRILGEKTHRADRLDDIITVRDGRYVISILDSEFNPKTAVVHDRSRSGATLYVEPTEAIELNNKLKQLLIDEAQEIERILLELTELARAHGDEFSENWNLYSRLDFIHAKATLASELGAVMPILKNRPQVSLQAAYHPLLLLAAKKRSDVIPLSVELGYDRTVIIITGPNTGGKTVALKTVGLLTLMTQAGLLIPVDSKTEVGVFRRVAADIGDEQSIELSLSTYSAHISRITAAVTDCDEHSLLLFDEIGVGTDPKEGAALAEAVIEHVCARNARCIVTTHYSALKAIAVGNPKVENASMEFDRATLRPTYRFRTGLPGSSYAVEVASRLGMPEEILKRAQALIGSQERSLADLIARLEAELMAASSERSELERKLKDADALLKSNQEAREKIAAREKQLFKEGFAEAEQLVESTRRKIEELLATLKSEKVSREDVRQSRKSLEDLRTELMHRAPIEPKVDHGAPPDEGDKVFVERLQTDGELIEIFPDRKKAKVRVGKVLYTMELADLRKLERGAANPELPDGVSYQPYHDQGDVSLELSLRGLTVEEARDRLDKYFDEIALTHAPYIRIVHGKGTGALRRLVREYLSKNKMVESFQLGERNEGSWGVTVVKLKS